MRDSSFWQQPIWVHLAVYHVINVRIAEHLAFVTFVAVFSRAPPSIACNCEDPLLLIPFGPSHHYE